jgi:formate/nitrite transporter FocA (FNT family)
MKQPMASLLLGWACNVFVSFGVWMFAGMALGAVPLTNSSQIS